MDPIILLLAVATLLYLLSGQLLWHRVLHGTDLQDDLEAAVLVYSDCVGSLPALIVKGSFLLAWPLWLAAGWTYGWIKRSRLTKRWRKMCGIQKGQDIRLSGHPFNIGYRIIAQLTTAFENGNPIGVVFSHDVNGNFSIVISAKGLSDFTGDLEYVMSEIIKKMGLEEFLANIRGTPEGEVFVSLCILRDPDIDYSPDRISSLDDGRIFRKPTGRSDSVH